MQYLVAITTLFVIGSLFGWVLEVLYRRIFSAKKWINPGFMTGPYIPLYGFGTVLLYGISHIDLSSLNVIWQYVIKALIIGVSLTLLELIAGLIFIKGMGLKLWDYSSRKWNYKGIICPLFSFLWLIAGSLFMFLIYPLLVDILNILQNNQIYSFLIGIVLGMMLVDASYSLHLATTLKKVKANMDERYEIRKRNYREAIKNFKEKSPISSPIKIIDKLSKHKKVEEEEKL